MKIVFATNNLHKLQEVRQILGDSFEVLSLKDIGCDVDIPETGQTLEENALQKARYVYDNYHIDCFADDTGLEVEALNGRQASTAPAMPQWSLLGLLIVPKVTIAKPIWRVCFVNCQIKTIARPVSALSSPSSKRKMCVPVVVPASNRNISSKVSSMAR